MDTKIKEEVKLIKINLLTKLMAMKQYVDDQYETKESPTFLNEGEAGEVNYDLLQAKNVHLAVLKTTENQINQFIAALDKVIEKVDPLNGLQWLAGVKKNAEELLADLNGLK